MLKRIILLAITAVGMSLTIAAERKGVQAIGLSKWSSTSARNCAAAIRESGIREVEFGFMPFFNPGNPWNNVDTLLAIPGVSKVETIL